MQRAKLIWSGFKRKLVLSESGGNFSRVEACGSADGGGRMHAVSSARLPVTRPATRPSEKGTLTHEAEQVSKAWENKDLLKHIDEVDQ